MQPRKVLAVDDSKLMLRMYEMMLRHLPLVFASDGVEALARLDEHADVGVVLLDLNMPNMGGLELLARLRGDGRLDRLAVIIVSTEGHEEEIQRGLQAGARAYITKPFDAGTLLDVVQRTSEEARS